MLGKAKLMILQIQGYYSISILFCQAKRLKNKDFWIEKAMDKQGRVCYNRAVTSQLFGRILQNRHDKGS